MKKLPLVICGLCFAITSRSQVGLYVTDGTTFSINVNTTVAIDGLVLMPTSKFGFSSANSIIRNASLTHASITPAIHRTFQWGATTPVYTGNIGILYEEAELNGLSEAELTLNIHDGSFWKAYNTGVIRNPTDNLVTTTVSGLQLNELTLAAEAAPLPLNWESISVNRRRKEAIVEWVTLNELNTTYFEVERSTNQIIWERIRSRIPANNTPDRHRYHLTDLEAPNSQTFYRVRQVDINEQFTYSPVVSISALHQSLTVSLYPNPATQQVFIQSRRLPLQALNLFTASGQLLRTERIALTSYYSFSIAWLPRGFYTVHLQLSDGSTESLYFIKR